ncbi:MAG TPA: amino acid dehydrogenase, partial [Nevskiaceae bacterium]|nr:amino acid dehydrogenase [Nevskiaceae bacterium]
ASRHDQMLRDRGVLYAPDYVINAGGIINIHYEGPNYRWAASESHLQRIGSTLTDVFQRADRERRPTGEIADRMAEEIFRPAS